MVNGKDTRFRKYLIHLFLKGYNGVNLESCLSSVDLANRGLFYEIKGEAKLSGIEDEGQILSIANTVREELRTTSAKEKMKPFARIEIHEIAPGDHIQIKHGAFNESLLCIAQNKYMVIDHNQGYLKCGSILTSTSTIWRHNEPITFSCDSEKQYRTEKVISMNQVFASDLNKYINITIEDEEKILYGNYKCCGDGVFEMEGFSLTKEEDSIFLIELNRGKGFFELLKGFDLTVIPNVDRCVIRENVTGLDYSIVERGQLSKINHTWKILSKCEIK